MIHLGMELYGPDGLCGRCKGGIHHISCRANHLESLWDGGDGVAMRHPHLRLLLEVLEQRIRGIDRLQVGTSVLTRVSLFDTPSQGVRDELGAIADTQHGDAPNKLRQVDLKGLRVMNRERRAA